jgi:hypothetical protein
MSSPSCSPARSTSGSTEEAVGYKLVAGIRASPTYVKGPCL